MIRFLKKILRLEAEENGKLKILKKVLPSEIAFKNAKKITFIKAIEYNDKAYNKSKEAINNGSLISFLGKHKFNANSDSLDFYYFEMKDNTNRLVILFDTYDPFESEYVMDIMDYQAEIVDFKSINDAEVIFEV